MNKRITYLILILFLVSLDLGAYFLAAYMSESILLDMLLGLDSGFRLFGIVLFILTWVGLAGIFGIYKLKRADRFLRIALRLITHVVTLAFIIQIIETIAFTNGFTLKKIGFLTAFFLMLLIIRLGVFKGIHYLRAEKQVFKKNVLLLGEPALTSDLSSFITNNPQIGLIVHRFKNEIITQFTTKDLKKIKIEAVYIHQKNANRSKYNKLLNSAALSQIPIYIFTDHDDIIKSSQVDYFGFIPVYKTQFSPLLQGINSYVKRMFDVLFSLAIIVLILSWLCPLVALFIRLESNGEVLFIQQRNGLGNTLFNCYKFRSMRVNASEAQAKKNDNRVTRVGRIIRKTSIDEFPQFFNVLKGDMSIVGPRPHMEIHNNNYAKQVESFQLRHSVKPGITGMAQMSGFRGEIKEDMDIINRIKYDIFYIRHWSFALDIKIILRTVINIFKGEEKAY